MAKVHEADIISVIHHCWHCIELYLPLCLSTLFDHYICRQLGHIALFKFKDCGMLGNNTM